MLRLVDRHWLTLLRVAILVAIAASSALYMHYIEPADSPFCGAQTACEAVRRSGYSYFGSTYVNTPLLGVVAYLLVWVVASGNALSLQRLRVVRALAGVGGVIALVLLIVQAVVVKAFCWLCVTVDVSATMAAFVALRSSTTERQLLHGWAWNALLAIAVIAPPMFTRFKPLPPIPPEIAALYEPGKINVVEASDFECPFCRALHPVLTELNQEFGDRVHFHRLHVPLPLHEQADLAARAHVCTQEQRPELAEQMADRLFTVELSEETISAEARGLQLDMPRFERCLGSTGARELVDRDLWIMQSSGFRGLPTTYIGGRRLIGLKRGAEYRAAYAEAAAGTTPLTIGRVPYALAVAIVVIGIGYAGRIRLR